MLNLRQTVIRGIMILKHFCSYQESANAANKRTLRKLACSFFQNGEVLCKKSYDGILLRCVGSPEGSKIMCEIPRSSLDPIWAYLRWPQTFEIRIMENDCFNHVRECHLCQIYQDKINQPPAPMHNITSPWPFSMWGIDITGMIHPKASNLHRFVLMGIDYFTKWVEVASFSNLTKAQMAHFIKQNTVPLYGLLNYYNRQCPEPQQQHYGCLVCTSQNPASDFKAL